jgi:hypothetical protein
LTHWTTQDGEKILIKKLKSPHLLNILKLLIRVACNRKVATELLYLRPPFGGPMGEMAQDCFKREFDQVMDMGVYDYLPPIWDSLETEAAKRGLKIPEFPHELDVSTVVLKLASRILEAQIEAKKEAK